MYERVQGCDQIKLIEKSPVVRRHIAPVLQRFLAERALVPQTQERI
jgi:hypothetical protein